MNNGASVGETSQSHQTSHERTPRVAPARLYALTAGTVVGAVATVSALDLPRHVALWGGAAAVAIGLSSVLCAIPTRRRPLLWLSIGLLLGIGRGATESIHTADLAQIAAEEGAARVEVTVTESWRPRQWGARTAVRWHSAERRGDAITVPERCQLEVRAASLDELPVPGTRLRALANVRTEDGHRVLLVVASARLLTPLGPPGGVHAVRDTTVRSLLAAADLDLDRIRAAELAASLSLGRRDLLPWGRKELWRRSGLSHVLAVSGLHIGLLAGFVWTIGVVVRAHPNVIRGVLVVAVPAYAILAGAATSAQRAALMLVVYLLARMAGRHVTAFTAVMLAVLLLVLMKPSLVLDPGFQLTAAITIVLVRWTPAIVRRLPLPPWFAGVVTVCALAQLTAAPIVLAHFREVNPGAFVTNLIVPVLLAPVLATAIAATVLAPLVPTLAALALSVLSYGERLLLAAGTLARSSVQVAPSVPLVLAWTGFLIGLGAVSPHRSARGAAALFAVFALATVGWSFLPARGKHDEITLAPVSDGACILVNTGTGRAIVDAGRWQHEAARHVADRRVQRVDAIVFTHADADHIGGAEALIGSLQPGRIIFPSWLRSKREFVQVRRWARAIGAREHPVARGSAVRIGTAMMTTIWPIYDPPDVPDNDRSLVARIAFAEGTALVTGDLTTHAERSALDNLPVASDLLIVPHHGSRGSCSQWLLERVRPDVALIPAGPDNLHGHPHPELLTRLKVRRTPARWPARDGWCGARWSHGQWQLLPSHLCRLRDDDTLGCEAAIESASYVVPPPSTNRPTLLP